MQTQTTSAAPRLVDPQELDRRVVERYRDVAHEAARDLHFPTGRPLAEALGHPADLLPRLPAQAVSSFAGVGYHLSLAHLLPGEPVLDLGSGSGMGVSAAAIQVDPRGSVTGVDVTPAARLRAAVTEVVLTSNPEPKRRAALLSLRAPPTSGRCRPALLPTVSQPLAAPRGPADPLGTEHPPGL